MNRPLVLLSTATLLCAVSCAKPVRSVAALDPVAPDPDPVAAEPGPIADPAAAESPIDCGAPIEGSEPLLEPGRLILMGELHGTTQIPMFVAELSCKAARSGTAVRLGLEIPRAESSAVAAFLASNGDEAALAALTAGSHWTRPDQDGRSSVATVSVLEHVRRWRNAGLEIVPFAFDVDEHGAWNERDASMAAEILKHSTADPDALVLVLSGNLHNRTSVGLPWDPEAVPMGVSIAGARPDMLSLDVRYRKGTAWICAPQCGVAEIGGSQAAPGETERSVALFESPNEFGHHGVFTVGAVEAAVPAVAGESG
ncbi:MAG: hypothetical protein ACRBN8_21725 [Nannocystales bacterium]